MNQIEDLQNKLDSASRVDSRRIQQQITDLQNEKNKVLKLEALVMQQNYDKKLNADYE